MATAPAAADTPNEGAAAGAEPGADESSEALLAELEAELGQGGDADGAKPAGKPVAKPDAGDEDDEDGGDGDDVTEDDAAAGEDDGEDEEDEDGDRDEDDDEEEDELAAAAAKDPELARRLAAVRRTEQRQREQLRRDRETFDRERSEWKSQTQQVTEAQKRFDAIAARAKFDPAGALVALGLTEADFEYAAQQVYARSKKAGGDPNYRAAAERAMRDREAAAELAEARREIKELKDGLTAKERQVEEDRQLEAYLGRVAKKATDETPLTKAQLAKNPAKARAALAVTANKLAAKLGALPKAAKVIAAHERRLARELRELGIEPPTAAAAGKPDKSDGKKAAAGAVTGAAGKKPGAKPAAKPEGEADRSPDGEIHHPTRDELLAELRAGATA